MWITTRDRFENHMENSSLKRMEDSKKESDYEENDDPYDDKFEEMMSGVTLNDSLENKCTDDNKKKKDFSKEDMDSRPFLKNHPSKNSENYKMDSYHTIEHIRDQFDDAGKSWFDKVLDSGVGGTDGWKAHLKGKGTEYFMTSGSERRATGNFVTKECPGETAQERKENLQLPEGNDASRVEKVISQKPTIVLESTVAPQEEWAKGAGYKAREGAEQTFTPTLDKEGAIHAGIYKMQNREEMELDAIDKNDIKQKIGR